MIRKGFILTVFGLGAACASAPKVDYAATPGADFSDYQTFSWVADDPQITERPGYSRKNDDRIEAAIVASLEDKGYVFVAEREAADFTVGYGVVIHNNVKTSGGSEYYGANWNHASGYLRVGGERLPTSEIGAPNDFWTGIHRDAGATVQDGRPEATLTIEIFDMSASSSVWRGYASKKITQHDRENPNEIIRTAVTSVFKSFPDNIAEEVTK